MKRGESDQYSVPDEIYEGSEEDGGSELYGTVDDVTAVLAGHGGADGGGGGVLNFYMPEGYRGVQQRIDESVTCGEVLVKMLKDRAKCEDAYANALRGWAKTWRDKIPEAAAYGRFGMSVRVLVDMADMLGEELSNAMQALVVSDDSVVGRLQRRNKEVYHVGFTGGVKESAECKSDFQKVQKRFAHAFRKLERSIRAYWDAAKKADAASNTYDTLMSQRADNRKIRSAKEAIDAADKVKSKRLEKYLKYYVVVDELRPKYMQQMQEKYAHYEQFELRRLTRMKNTLDELAEVLRKTANDHTNAFEQFDEAMINFKPQDDLDFWSMNFGPGMPFDMSSFRDYPPDRVVVRSPGPPVSQTSEKAASTVGAPIGRRHSTTSVGGNQRDRSCSRNRTSRTSRSNSSTSVYETATVAGGGSPGALPRTGDRKSSQTSTPATATRDDKKQYSRGPISQTRPSPPGLSSQPLMHMSTSYEMPSVSMPPPPPPPPPPPHGMSLTSMPTSAGGSQQSLKTLPVPRGLLQPPTPTPGVRRTAEGVRLGEQSVLAASSVGSKGFASGAYVSARSQRQSTLVLPAELKTPRRETKSSMRNFESSRLTVTETKYFFTNYPYEAAESDECSALPGDVLRLYARDEASDEWWMVVNLNAPGQPFGNIPKTYVEQIDEDEWQGLWKEQQAHRHEMLAQWVASGGTPDI